MLPTVTIVIPAYDRAHVLPQAIETGLAQSHPATTVMAIDDGSSDDTYEVMQRYAGHPRFTAVRLAANCGTARAKNVGIALSASDAVTFHDSDDLPHRDKVMRQARVMGNETIGADPCLNWRFAGREPGETLKVGAVFTHHELILPDGGRVEIRRTLSLVDDFFPNLQMAAGPPGDWTHVNSGLFHRSVFDRLGGFGDCIEEDREFRNRLIMAGEILWVIPDILLTKIETPDGLTQHRGTGYDSPRRLADRRRVWETVDRWLATRKVVPVPIDLTGIHVLSCTNPGLCAPGPLEALRRGRPETVA